MIQDGKGKNKIAMIVPEPKVMGGIAAVTNGYYGSKLEADFQIKYIESYCDGSKYKKLFKAIRSYIVFLCELVANKPDLVHIHSSFGPSFYRKMPYIIMANWFHIPVVNHIHGADFDSFYTQTSTSKQNRIKKTYNKCAVLIALSEEWKKRLSLIVPEDKIEVVPNYSILHEDAILGRGEHKKKTVLFLGELGHRKGTYDIPDIVACVKEELPNDTEMPLFILAGAGSSEDETNIKKKITELKLGSYVLFPGWIRGEDKDRTLREADVFLLPSYNEGMPMSILDACGYGLPIVSTNVGGIPQIVQNNVNGYTLEPGDIQGFAGAIVRLVTDEQLRTDYSTASYNLVEREYSLDRHISKLEDIWSRCI